MFSHAHRNSSTHNKLARRQDTSEWHAAGLISSARRLSTYRSIARRQEYKSTAKRSIKSLVSEILKSTTALMRCRKIQVRREEALKVIVSEVFESTTAWIQVRREEGLIPSSQISLSTTALIQGREIPVRRAVGLNPTTQKTDWHINQHARFKKESGRVLDSIQSGLKPCNFALKG